MRTRNRINGEILRRANESIAHGSLTNSKRSSSFVEGVYPTHLSRGCGAKVYDVNDNCYIDFICGLGANIVGYGNEEISEAIHKQARRGCTLSLGTEIEIKAAEQVKILFPFIERLRFLKTGAEATMAAVTIARAYTGNSEILSDGYHGWLPEFTSLTEPANGCPPATFIDSFKSVSQINRNTAAVIVEPIITDMSQDRISFLKTLREICTEFGTILIFDEIVSGFRVPGFSMAARLGITPDLICLGKAVANGMPLSIVGGSKEIMECDYFVSSTFAGETISLAAAIKTMDILSKKESLSFLWEKGAAFMSKFNLAGEGVIQLEGYPTRSKFVGSNLNVARFFQECCKAGILVGPSFFFSFPHIDLIDDVLSIFTDIITRIKTGSVELDGELPVAPFAQKVRDE